jgi:cell volume regulation protein A
MIEFSTNGLILMGGIFLLAGVLMTKVSSRAGVPSLVLFMIIGMVLGSDISGLIYFSNAEIAQLVGIVALIFILFEGGCRRNGNTSARSLEALCPSPPLGSSSPPPL